MMTKHSMPFHIHLQAAGRRWLRSGLGFLIAAGIVAPVPLSAQQTTVTVMPYIQRWTLSGAERFSQAGVEASLTVPLFEGFEASVRGVPVQTGGDIAPLNGMTDTQLSLKYTFPSTKVIMTLGVNAPTGMVNLTREEFLASVLLSNTVFRLHVPQFGQGWNINPGILYAFPLSEQAAMGLGLSYEYAGSYHPVASVGAYDPGDEIPATAGLDFTLAEGETVSIDGIVRMFGKDVLEGEQVYHAGSSVTVGVQYVRSLGFSRFTGAARYRSKGKSDISVAGQLVGADQKVEPDTYELQAAYSARIADSFTGSVQIAGRYYSETTLPISGIVLFTAGAGAEYRTGIGISFPALFAYHIGTRKGGDGISGIEASIGLRFSI